MCQLWQRRQHSEHQREANPNNYKHLRTNNDHAEHKYSVAVHLLICLVFVWVSNIKPQRGTSVIFNTINGTHALINNTQRVGNVASIRSLQRSLIFNRSNHDMQNKEYTMPNELISLRKVITHSHYVGTISSWASNCKDSLICCRPRKVTCQGD